MNDLWAITSFFNPAGFRRRRLNYRIFRAHLTVPLLTVELSFTGEFELEPADADRLIRLRGGSVLWQKERLLNIAAAALPDSCRYVAWLDADVIFDDEDWPIRACEVLRRTRLLQLYSCAIDLPEGCRSPRALASEACDRLPSTMYAAASGDDVARSLRYPKHRSVQTTANGLAWAAHREFFDAAGLYDACILGSGDRALACAVLGLPDTLNAALEFCRAQASHYMGWTRLVSAWVGDASSALEGNVFHLWHGPPERRLLATRYAGLRRFRFDPSRDIALTPEQVWRWASDKAGLHEYVEDYFRQRMEDG